MQAFQTNFLVRKRTVSKVFWAMSIYEKFFHREIRWKKLVLTRCKLVKKEITFEQNNLNCFLQNQKRNDSGTCTNVETR